MAWLIFILFIVAIIIAIILLNRFYRKASREVALIRTGAGGQKVVMDGGCLALPFLHRISEVNMRTTRLEIERSRERSIITSDRLRVDATVEFYVRVEPSEKGVATAAQALAGKTFRAEDLATTLEGKLVDAVLSVAARYTMDELQNKRADYVREVSEMLRDNLAQNGLVLESVALTRLDQTPFHALDENNAFNAVGMRRLAELVATSKKERAVIEADADTAVRKSKLDATKQRLLLEQQEEEAQVLQRINIEKQRAEGEAAIAEQQALAEQRRDSARINREREVRKQDIEAKQASEIRQLERDITLAAKQADVARAQVETEKAKAEEARAQEELQTARESAIAEREKLLALIRAAEQAEVDDTRVRSEAGTVLAMAKAEAEAIMTRAEADQAKMLAEAAGSAAIIKSENTYSPDLIRMKLDLRKLETLPKVVDSMMKPAEKIDSIRINQIGGFGGAATGDNGSNGDKAMVNQVVDGILSMALQLPAVKKMGEEIGINIGAGMQGLTDSANASSNTTQYPEQTPEENDNESES